jgi:hypothetical protein
MPWSTYPVVLTKVGPQEVPPQSHPNKFAYDMVVLPGREVHIFGKSSLGWSWQEVLQQKNSPSSAHMPSAASMYACVYKVLAQGQWISMGASDADTFLGLQVASKNQVWPPPSNAMLAKFDTAATGCWTREHSLAMDAFAGHQHVAPARGCCAADQ